VLRITVFILSIVIMTIAHASYARTNLSLPRFVTVKTTEANVRSGPGLRYRIEWVMVRPNMPLEVIAEYEQWRKIKDIQGDEGWIHRSMLSNRKTVIVTGEKQILRKSSHPDSAPVAQIEVGVNAKLLACGKEACRISANNINGWINSSNLWGIYPNEMAK
jgi:SH3-like domain-containing protein